MKKTIAILFAGLLIGASVAQAAPMNSNKAQFATFYYHMPKYGTAVGIGADKPAIGRILFNSLVKGLGMGHRDRVKPNLPARCAWSNYIEGSYVLFVFYSQKVAMGAAMCNRFAPTMKRDGWDREM